LVAEEVPRHLPPGGQRPRLALIQRGGRGPLLGRHVGQFQPGQLGQGLGLLLIIAATDENAKASHHHSSENARTETPLPPLSVISAVADHWGNLSQHLCALTVFVFSFSPQADR